MLVAVAGKFGGSAIAARITGLSWREAGALGILMNTRGLLELVILTIGLDIGVISPALFTIMVMMALVTTAMTTPVVQWLYPAHELRNAGGESTEPLDYTVIVPVSLPTSGPGLLQVARAVVPEGRDLRVYGLHLRRVPESTLPPLESSQEMRPASDVALQPLLRAAEEDSTLVRPMAFVSERPARDIVDVAHAKGAQLIVMGWHKPVISHTILGGVVSDVLSHATCDVAVYVQRRMDAWRRVLVPYRDASSDGAALEAALRIAKEAGAELTVLRVLDAPSDISLRTEALADMLPLERLQAAPAQGLRVRVVRTTSPVDCVVEEVCTGGHDLVVIGVAKTWGLTPSFFGVRHERIVAETSASLLIVRRHRTHDDAGR
jgi:nucleotide-binding universal stress UspA family protein